MKPTDVVVPIRRPKVNTSKDSSSLHLVVIRSTKYSPQVIPLPTDKGGPDYITFVVPTEPGEWVKFNIEERRTIKLNSPKMKGDKIDNEQVVPCRSIFNYTCYNLVAEKRSNYIEDNCEYFVTTSEDILVTNNNQSNQSTAK